MEAAGVSYLPRLGDRSRAQGIDSVSEQCLTGQPTHFESASPRISATKGENRSFPISACRFSITFRRISHQFVAEYRAEYTPDQLADYDVLISLKPKVTAQSLQGISRLCAIGRCGVGYDNVDLDACTEHGIAVFITPGGVVRPVAESILLFILALSHNLVVKDRLVRMGRWARKHPSTWAGAAATCCRHGWYGQHRVRGDPPASRA